MAYKDREDEIIQSGIGQLETAYKKIPFKIRFYDGTEFYTQGICKVDVVDAMGAGDAFIAAFLRHYADNKDMKEALSYAAERAAYACTYAGGFGHPHKA